MSVLLDAKFSSGLDGFSAGTRAANDSAVLGDPAGVLTVGAGVSAVYTLGAAVTTGVVRLDVWFKVTDTITRADGAADSFIKLLNASDNSAALSIAAVHISRNTANGATASLFNLRYGGSAGTAFAPATYPRGDHWYRLSLVVDLDTDVYEIFLNGIYWHRGLATPNAAENLHRVMLQGGANAPDMWFDNVRLEDSYVVPALSSLVTDDFTVGSGAVEDSTPATDLVSLFSQRWVVGAAAAYSAPFTRGANGLTPAAKLAACFVRTGGDGEWTAVFTASDETSAKTTYGGILFRAYDGFESTNSIQARYWSGAAGNKIALIASGAAVVEGALNASTPNTTGTGNDRKINASSQYTLRVVAQGRIVSVYLNDVLQLGPTTISTANAYHGNDMAGPVVRAEVANVGVDNYVRSFGYVGRLNATRRMRTVGAAKFISDIGGVKQWYRTDAGNGAQDLLWSQGVQCGHRPQAELSRDLVGQQQTLFNLLHCAAYHQRGLCISSDKLTARADLYLTLSRRGVWTSDGITVLTTTSDNVSPDLDLRGQWFRDNGYKIVDDAGTVTTLANTPAHDWRSDDAALALPCGAQFLATFPAGASARVTQITANGGNLGGAALFIDHKFRDDGGAVSHLVGNATGLAAGTEYRFTRLIFVDVGAALSNTDLQDMRADIATPAALTMAVGTLKTDAAGDVGADGFNERHGWHEVTCAAGAASFTLVKGTPAKRHGPTFRFWSYTLGASPQVTIAGSVGVAGTDYVLDDVGDGTAILQLLTHRTADTTIVLAAGGGAGPGLSVLPRSAYALSNPGRDSFDTDRPYQLHNPA